jgi:hypothetical protein
MLDELRRNAIDLVRAEDWNGLLALEQELRADTQQWIPMWAPSCALAARNLDSAAGRSYLDEAIAGGFFQPVLFEPELSAAFGSDPGWAAMLQEMADNTPPPPIALTSWPSIRPTAPLELYRLPSDREALLRQRMPASQQTAWETAKSLLTWTTNAWEHTSNDHVANQDAVEVLDRVSNGERFACVEYSIVLSQSLNAAGIPARRAVLRFANYHAGFGTGHVVSEAWIDDLNKWVVLDGQNGFYWVSEAGTPLGLLELQQLFRDGDRASVVCLSRPASDDDVALWWTYFSSTYVNGVAWSDSPVSAYFEGAPRGLPELVANPRDAYPDLSEIGVALVTAEGRPAIQPRPVHPFATGYRVSDGLSTVDCSLTEPWVFPERSAGSHEIQIAAKTPYGTTQPVTLTWQST